MPRLSAARGEDSTAGPAEADAAAAAAAAATEARGEETPTAISAIGSGRRGGGIYVLRRAVPTGWCVCRGDAARVLLPMGVGVGEEAGAGARRW